MYLMEEFNNIKAEETKDKLFVVEVESPLSKNRNTAAV
jgi:hypothetical protein